MYPVGVKPIGVYAPGVVAPGVSPPKTAVSQAEKGAFSRSCSLFCILLPLKHKKRIHTAASNGIWHRVSQKETIHGKGCSTCDTALKGIGHLVSLTIDWVVGVAGVVGCEPGGGDIPPKGDPVGLTTMPKPTEAQHGMAWLSRCFCHVCHVCHICAPHIPLDGGEKPIRGGGTGVDASRQHGQCSVTVYDSPCVRWSFEATA